MCADDTSLEDIQSHHKEYTLNQELPKVYKWLLANKLKLNVAKTKYMIFSKRNKKINPIYLKSNINVIEHVHQFVFLGLHLNITSTSRYQLAVLLNSINDTHDIMCNVVEHIGIISLLSFKATIKRYLNNTYSYYCSIINFYICKQYH